MSRDDIKEIVATEYANAVKAWKRGQAMIANAGIRRRRAMRAMLALKMEAPIDEDVDS